jgi:hypothetical protein
MHASPRSAHRYMSVSNVVSANTSHFIGLSAIAARKRAVGAKRTTAVTTAARTVLVVLFLILRNMLLNSDF